MYGKQDSTGVAQKAREQYDREDYVTVGAIFDNSTRTNKQTLRAQKILNRYGYALEEDGFYGPQTDKAVKKYVSDYGIDYMWNEMKSKVEGVFK